MQPRPSYVVLVTPRTITINDGGDVERSMDTDDFALLNTLPMPRTIEDFRSFALAAASALTDNERAMLIIVRDHLVKNGANLPV
jgi:hypothetical protein